MPLIWDHIPLFEGTRRVLVSYGRIRKIVLDGFRASCSGSPGSKESLVMGLGFGVWGLGFRGLGD